MLMAPRLLEMLVLRLSGDPLLQDRRTLPGGIWRDVIPQDQEIPLPAMVVSLVIGLPNTNQPQFFDLTVELRGQCAGTSVEPLRAAMDRADALVRAAGQGEHDQIRYSAARKVQEIERTTTEAGLLFAHLGGQYLYTCSEPPIFSQL